MSESSELQHFFFAKAMPNGDAYFYEKQLRLDPLTGLPKDTQLKLVAVQKYGSEDVISLCSLFGAPKGCKLKIVTAPNHQILALVPYAFATTQGNSIYEQANLDAQHDAASYHQTLATLTTNTPYKSSDFYLNTHYPRPYDDPTHGQIQLAHQLWRTYIKGRAFDFLPHEITVNDSAHDDSQAIYGDDGTSLPRFLNVTASISNSILTSHEKKNLLPKSRYMDRAWLPKYRLRAFAQEQRQVLKQLLTKAQRSAQFAQVLAQTEDYPNDIHVSPQRNVNPIYTGLQVLTANHTKSRNSVTTYPQLRYVSTATAQLYPALGYQPQVQAQGTTTKHLDRLDHRLDLARLPEYFDGSRATYEYQGGIECPNPYAFTLQLIEENEDKDDTQSLANAAALQNAQDADTSALPLPLLSNSYQRAALAVAAYEGGHLHSYAPVSAQIRHAIYSREPKHFGNWGLHQTTSMQPSSVDYATYTRSNANGEERDLYPTNTSTLGLYYAPTPQSRELSAFTDMGIPQDNYSSSFIAAQRYLTAPQKVQVIPRSVRDLQRLPALGSLAFAKQHQQKYWTWTDPQVANMPDVPSMASIANTPSMAAPQASTNVAESATLPLALDDTNEPLDAGVGANTIDTTDTHALDPTAMSNNAMDEAYSENTFITSAVNGIYQQQTYHHAEPSSVAEERHTITTHYAGTEEVNTDEVLNEELNIQEQEGEMVNKEQTRLHAAYQSHPEYDYGDLNNDGVAQDRENPQTYEHSLASQAYNHEHNAADALRAAGADTTSTLTAMTPSMTTTTAPDDSQAVKSSMNLTSQAAGENLPENHESSRTQRVISSDGSRTQTQAQALSSAPRPSQRHSATTHTPAPVSAQTRAQAQAYIASLQAHANQAVLAVKAAQKIAQATFGDTYEIPPFQMPTPASSSRLGHLNLPNVNTPLYEDPYYIPSDSAIAFADQHAPYHQAFSHATSISRYSYGAEFASQEEKEVRSAKEYQQRGQQLAQAPTPALVQVQSPNDATTTLAFAPSFSSFDDDNLGMATSPVPQSRTNIANETRVRPIPNTTLIQQAQQVQQQPTAATNTDGAYTSNHARPYTPVATPWWRDQKVTEQTAQNAFAEKQFHQSMQGSFIGTPEEFLPEEKADPVVNSDAHTYINRSDLAPRTVLDDTSDRTIVSASSASSLAHLYTNNTEPNRDFIAPTRVIATPSHANASPAPFTKVMRSPEQSNTILSLESYVGSQENTAEALATLAPQATTDATITTTTTEATIPVSEGLVPATLANTNDQNIDYHSEPSEDFTPSAYTAVERRPLATHQIDRTFADFVTANGKKGTDEAAAVAAAAAARNGEYDPPFNESSAEVSPAPTAVAWHATNTTAISSTSSDLAAVYASDVSQNTTVQNGENAPVKPTAIAISPAPMVPNNSVAQTLPRSLGIGGTNADGEENPIHDFSDFKTADGSTVSGDYKFPVISQKQLQEQRKNAAAQAKLAQEQAEQKEREQLESQVNQLLKDLQKAAGIEMMVAHNTAEQAHELTILKTKQEKAAEQAKQDALAAEQAAIAVAAAEAQARAAQTAKEQAAATAAAKAVAAKQTTQSTQSAQATAPVTKPSTLKTAATAVSAKQQQPQSEQKPKLTPEATHAPVPNTMATTKDSAARKTEPTPAVAKNIAPEQSTVASSNSAPQPTTASTTSATEARTDEQKSHSHKSEANTTKTSTATSATSAAPTAPVATTAPATPITPIGATEVQPRASENMGAVDTNLSPEEEARRNRAKLKKLKKLKRAAKRKSLQDEDGSDSDSDHVLSATATTPTVETQVSWRTNVTTSAPASPASQTQAQHNQAPAHVSEDKVASTAKTEQTHAQSPSKDQTVTNASSTKTTVNSKDATHTAQRKTLTAPAPEMSAAQSHTKEEHNTESKQSKTADSLPQPQTTDATGKQAKASEVQPRSTPTTESKQPVPPTNTAKLESTTQKIVSTQAPEKETISASENQKSANKTVTATQAQTIATATTAITTTSADTNTKVASAQNVTSPVTAAIDATKATTDVANVANVAKTKVDTLATKNAKSPEALKSTAATTTATTHVSSSFAPATKASEAMATPTAKASTGDTKGKDAANTPSSTFVTADSAKSASLNFASNSSLAVMAPSYLQSKAFAQTMEPLKTIAPQKPLAATATTATVATATTTTPRAQSNNATASTIGTSKQSFKKTPAHVLNAETSLEAGLNLALAASAEDDDVGETEHKAAAAASAAKATATMAPAPQVTDHQVSAATPAVAATAIATETTMPTASAPATVKQETAVAQANSNTVPRDISEQVLVIKAEYTHQSIDELSATIKSNNSNKPMMFNAINIISPAYRSQTNNTEQLVTKGQQLADRQVQELQAELKAQQQEPQKAPAPVGKNTTTEVAPTHATPEMPNVAKANTNTVAQATNASVTDAHQATAPEATITTRTEATSDTIVTLRTDVQQQDEDQDNKDLTSISASGNTKIITAPASDTKPNASSSAMASNTSSETLTHGTEPTTSATAHAANAKATTAPNNQVMFASPKRFVEQKPNQLFTEPTTTVSDTVKAMQKAVADVVATPAELDNETEELLNSNDFGTDEDPTLSYLKAANNSNPQNTQNNNGHNPLASLAAELIDDFDDPFDDSFTEELQKAQEEQSADPTPHIHKNSANQSRS